MCHAKTIEEVEERVEEEHSRNEEEERGRTEKKRGKRRRRGVSEPSRRDHVEEAKRGGGGKQQAFAPVSKRLRAVVMQRGLQHTATSQSEERKATAELSRYHRSPRKKRSLAVSVDSLFSVTLSRQLKKREPYQEKQRVFVV